jgi:PTH1 family peptidyl-tRNA hydrolase
MHLLVGLGNPGAAYSRNRHNIGFMAADEIVRRHGFSAWRNKFQGQLAEGQIDGEKILVLKPQTFMNLSGQSVGEAARFHKIEPENVIVVYDELDLAPGKVRIKQGGGSGGHNGIKSIDQHLGADYWRVRLGIGHPGDKSRVHGHVLSDFHKEDEDWLAALLDAVAKNASFLVGGNHAEFMNKIALALPKGEG